MVSGGGRGVIFGTTEDTEYTEKGEWMEKKELLFEEETFALRGAVFEVYKEKGCGFLEAVYQECLQIELRLRSVPFVAQPRLELEYKGQKL